MGEAQEKDTIVWQGDLNDDCRAEHRGIRAHAEHMGRGWWYCMVWEEGHPEALFHSNDVGVVLRSGQEARNLCEYLLRLFASHKEAAG